MKEVISKELLSEVLFDSRVDIQELVKTRDNSLNYSIFASINERDGTSFNSNIEGNYYVEKRTMYDDINIYELAHKCKEWANQHSYLLESDITGICKFNPDETCCYEGYFEASTEPEAIFKACRWILEERRQNDRHK